MTKITIVCGLIAGVIVSVMMVISVAMCYHNENYQGNMFLGYATMLLAFSLVFFGIKNYRDKHNNGVISFGRAFKIGMYISLIASSMYVLVWLIDYYLFVPDFMEKYTAQVIRQTRAEGASQVEINNKVTEMNSFKELYKNPLMIVLISYSEILPVGIVVALISAAWLKRKR